MKPSTRVSTKSLRWLSERAGDYGLKENNNNHPL
jgi:hypothetical protein